MMDITIMVSDVTACVICAGDLLIVAQKHGRYQQRHRVELGQMGKSEEEKAHKEKEESHAADIRQKIYECLGC